MVPVRSSTVPWTGVATSSQLASSRITIDRVSLGYSVQ